MRDLSRLLGVGWLVRGGGRGERRDAHRDVAVFAEDGGVHDVGEAAVVQRFSDVDALEVDNCRDLVKKMSVSGHVNSTTRTFQGAGKLSASASVMFSTTKSLKTNQGLFRSVLFSASGTTR